MKILKIASDGDKFKKGDGVMFGTCTDDTYKKAIVIEDIDIGSVKIKFRDGTEEITDKDNVNFPEDLNFDFLRDELKEL